MPVIVASWIGVVMDSPVMIALHRTAWWHVLPVALNHTIATKRLSSKTMLENFLSFFTTVVKMWVVSRFAVVPASALNEVCGSLCADSALQILGIRVSQSHMVRVIGYGTVPCEHCNN